VGSISCGFETSIPATLQELRKRKGRQVLKKGDISKFPGPIFTIEGKCCRRRILACSPLLFFESDLVNEQAIHVASTKKLPAKEAIFSQTI